MRYAYLPGQACLLLWFFLLSRAPAHSLKSRAIASAAILVLCFWPLSQWNDIYTRPDLAWPKTAAALQRFLDLRVAGLIRTETVVKGMQVHPNYYHSSRMSITFEPDGRIFASADTRSKPIP